MTTVSLISAVFCDFLPLGLAPCSNLLQSQNFVSVLNLTDNMKAPLPSSFAISLSSAMNWTLYSAHSYLGMWIPSSSPSGLKTGSMNDWKHYSKFRSMSHSCFMFENFVFFLKMKFSSSYQSSCCFNWTWSFKITSCTIQALAMPSVFINVPLTFCIHPGCSFILPGCSKMSKVHVVSIDSLR
jgi:hypothetical protein